MIIKIKYKILSILRHKGLIRIKKTNNPLRWGIIGLGHMAETFSTAIDGSKDGIVYAVASRNIEKAKRFASNHGHCKSYGSYIEMVQDTSLNLDVIYIATPVKYHYEHIKLCLEAGKNILCEKPITKNAEQLRELRSIAKSNNCFLMEGMWMKCLPTFQKAIEWIDEGKIGEPELVKVDFYKRNVICQDHAIYNSKEEGGVLHDFGVYAIAFMNHFLRGIPDNISSYCRKTNYGTDTDWQIMAQKGNIHAALNLSSNFSGLSKAAVVGQYGVIEWDSQFNRTNRICLYDTMGNLIKEFKPSFTHEGFEYEVNEVQNCIRKGVNESAIVSLTNSENTLKIIDQLLSTTK